VTRAEYKLTHPAPGSRIEAARDFGVDLSMLVERLRLPLEERLEDLERVMTDLEEMTGLVRAHDKAQRNAGPARQE
jgi:hypothetical protein